MANQTVGDLLQAIAAKQPSPGGGAVAALTLALGAALAEMVLNYSKDKQSLEAHAAKHEMAANQIQSFRQRALELADEDARAYEALNAVMRRKENPPTTEQRDKAVVIAIDVPLEVLRLSAQLAELLDRLAGTTNRFLDSDLAMAAILADAAARSACCNVRINVPELSSQALRTEYAEQMNAMAEAATSLARRVQDALRSETK